MKALIKVEKKMVKFVVAGVQRTGSTLICSSLDSHPNIYCDGEAFKVKNWKKSNYPYVPDYGYLNYVEQSMLRRVLHLCYRKKPVEEYLNDFFQKSAQKAVGFKLMYSHVKRFPTVVPYVKEHDFKIIHLERKNILKVWVSTLGARQRGFHSQEKVGRIKIFVPLHNLRKRLDWLNDQSGKWKDIFSKSNDYIHVEYESFVKDKPAQLGRLCDFLGVETQILESNLKKLTSDDLSQVIENYDEVKKLLIGTPYHYCLDAE